MFKKILYSLSMAVLFGVYVMVGRSNSAQTYIPVLKDTSTGTGVLNVQSFKDGEYTGKRVFAFYGYVQVEAAVLGGKLTEVRILDYPFSRQTSEVINSQALPMLIQEALTVQSANVDIVTGATDTSKAFKESLASALSQAD